MIAMILDRFEVGKEPVGQMDRFARERMKNGFVNARLAECFGQTVGKQQMQRYVEADQATVESTVMDGAKGEPVARVDPAADIHTPRHDMAGGQKFQQMQSANRALLTIAG